MPRTTVKRIVLVSVLVTGCALAFLLGNFIAFPPPLAGSALAVEAEALDFGTVWEDSDFSWPLAIRNTTARQVVITDFAVSCGCVSAEPKALELGPGAIRTVQLKVDLAHGRKAMTSMEWNEKPSHPFEVRIRPVWSFFGGGSGQNIIWEVHGNVRPLFNFDSSTPLHFSITSPDGPEQRLGILLRTPASRVSADFDSSLLKVVLPKIDADDLEIPVRVKPVPQLTQGSYKTTLKVKAFLPSIQHWAACEIPVYIAVEDDVQVRPGRLLLGPVALGQELIEEVALECHSREPFEVKDIMAPAGIRVRPIGGHQGDELKRFSIRWRAGQPGQQAIRVHFEVTTRSGRRFRPEVQLSFFCNSGEEQQARPTPVLVLGGKS